MVQQRWEGGHLAQLIDANGQTTTWERDDGGRVVRERRAVGVTQTTYVSSGTGRLLTVTDPQQQVTTYAHALDDAVTGLTSTNAQVPTPGTIRCIPE